MQKNLVGSFKVSNFALAFGTEVPPEALLSDSERRLAGDSERIGSEKFLKKSCWKIWQFKNKSVTLHRNSARLQNEGNPIENIEKIYNRLKSSTRAYTVAAFGRRGRKNRSSLVNSL